MLGKSNLFFLLNSISFSNINRYIRRRDLHTVLPKHTISTLNNSPRLSKTISIEDSQSNLSLKRPKLSSTSSDSGIVADSDGDAKVKRAKLEDINESSPKTNSDSI
jgi:hypothetical protein